MAEVKISITAEDGTKQVFSAVREGAKTAFDTAKTSAIGAAGGIGQFQSATKSASSTAFEFIKGMAGWEMIKQVGRWVKDLAMDMLDIASSAEKTRIMLDRLMGSAAAGKESFQWLLDFSTKAPFSLEAISNSFIKLQVSGLDPMSGKLQILTDAVAAFGGSSDELKRVSIAIQQMSGKGVISMEELRQQIGEVLPTAMKAMAREMGMTMSELSDKVGSGAVDAKTGLDALFAGLEKDYAGAGEKMMDSWSGIMANLKVQWTKFVLYVSEAGAFESLKSAAKDLKIWIDDAFATGKVKEWAHTISTVINDAVLVIKGLAFSVGVITDTFSKLQYILSGMWIDDGMKKLMGLDEVVEDMSPALQKVKAEWIANRQALESAGAQTEQTTKSTNALTKTLNEYGDVIKDVNADLLKFAGADFAKNLKDQEKSTDGMAQALQGYLNVTDAVYNKRLQMLFVLGQETDMELQSTAVQKAQAEARLGAWSQYYETLKVLHNSAIEAQKTKTKELLDLETRIKDQRQGYADLTLSLNQKLMTETQKYYSTQEDLELKYKSALTLTGQAKIDALTKYQTAMSATANAVTQDGQERISLEEAVATALEKNATAQEEILKAQEALKLAKQAEIDQIGVWQVSLETAMAKATEMMGLYTTQITNLGTVIDGLQMNKTLTVDTAGAVTQVNSLKGAIDSIPDITYKQIIITTAGGASSGDGFQSDSSMSGFHPQPLATGTPYVKKEGLFYLHVGEAVTPASMNNNNSRKTTINFSGMNININGANKDGKQLAREIDEELATLVKNERSRLAKALK